MLLRFACLTTLFAFSSFSFSRSCAWASKEDSSTSSPWGDAILRTPEDRARRLRALFPHPEESLDEESRSIFDRLLTEPIPSPLDRKRVETLSLASFVDHTLLRPNASIDMIDTLCDEASRYQFRSVCVNGSRLARVLDRLKRNDSNVRACAVAGFPLGAGTLLAKVFEVESLFLAGADEVDMVMNIGAFKDRDYSTVLDELRSAVRIARWIRPNCVVKVIIESGLLSDEEIITASLLVAVSGADFVKTSTGFAAGVPAATPRSVYLMRSAVGRICGVKAAGGVRSREDAYVMIQAGATRIGTSSGVSLVSSASTPPSAY